MLTPDYWDALSIDPAVLRGRAAFFAAYAGAVAEHPPLDVDADFDASSSGAPTGRLYSFGDAQAADVPEVRVAVTPPRAARPAWVAHAEQADAWRESGVAALPVDVPAGMDALRQAGEAYVSAQVPFGLVLEVLTGGARTEAVWRAAGYLVAATRSEAQEFDEPDGLQRAATVPAQQIGLLLAMGSDPLVTREYEHVIGDWRDLPQSRSQSTFGSSGAPLAAWWQLGLELLRVDTSPAVRARLKGRVAALASAHGELLGRARADAFHWRSGSAPVDVVDLDLCIAVALIGRRLRASGQRGFRAADFRSLSPLARVSVQVGIEMSSYGQRRRGS